MHVKNHFFLAKKESVPSISVPCSIITSPDAPSIRPFSYESIDFGEPPDMDPDWEF